MANMFDENGNYNKTEWKPGDRITAGKLNKIEESLEAINNNDIERHKEADERLDALEEQNEAVEERFDELEDLVADNKTEVDTAIYEVHSKMDRLEQEMNDGIDTVEAIAHTVDDKIAEADASMKAQVAEAEDIVDQGKVDMEAMVAEVSPSFGYEYSVYQTFKGRQDDLYINVKDFGAKGDAMYCNYNANGTIEGWYTDSSMKNRATDDTLAIQRAIDYAQNTTGIPSRKARVFFPKGGYFISSKLTSTSGVSLEGGGSFYPRYGNYNNTHLSQSVIICCDESFTSECLIHFLSSNGGVENIEFTGNKKTIGIKFRSYGESDKGSMASNYYLKNVTVTNHLVGIGIKEYSYGRLEYVYVSDNIKYGIHAITAGDTMYLNCNFSHTGADTTIDDQLYGSALYLDASCGNSTIIGGKIEYNRIGLSIHSQGIIVNSVQFDNNKFCNIRMHSNDIACTSIVSNCRFLGGGYENIGSAQCASILLMGSSTSNYQFPIDINISNCMFKMAPYGVAAEYGTSALTTVTKQLIRMTGGGIKRLNLNNNSINNSSASPYDIYSSSNDNERSYIKTDNFKIHPSVKIPVFHGGCINTYYREGLSNRDDIRASFNYGDVICRSGYEYAVGIVTKWLCVRPGTTYNVDLSTIVLTGVKGEYTVVSSTTIVDKLFVGDYIKITNSKKVFYKIYNIDYSTNTIYLEQPLDDDITDSEVMFATPMWRAVERVLE